jgi:hypothetical protein
MLYSIIDESKASGGLNVGEHRPFSSLSRRGGGTIGVTETSRRSVNRRIAGGSAQRSDEGQNLIADGVPIWDDDCRTAAHSYSTVEFDPLHPTVVLS